MAWVRKLTRDWALQNPVVVFMVTSTISFHRCEAFSKIIPFLSSYSLHLGKGWAIPANKELFTFSLARFNVTQKENQNSGSHLIKALRLLVACLSLFCRIAKENVASQPEDWNRFKSYGSHTWMTVLPAISLLNQTKTKTKPFKPFKPSPDSIPILLVSSLSDKVSWSTWPMRPSSKARKKGAIKSGLSGGKCQGVLRL